MRFSFVPLLEVNLGAVVSLFLLRIAYPRLIGLLVRSVIGLLAGINFRRLSEDRQRRRVLKQI